MQGKMKNTAINHASGLSTFNSKKVHTTRQKKNTVQFHERYKFFMLNQLTFSFLSVQLFTHCGQEPH
jgi:hypothetical protein